jgi:hypothetical protein
MCLNIITSREPKKEGVGWKVFREKPWLGGELYSVITDNPVTLSVWLTAGSCKLPEGPGFHIYTDMKDARYLLWSCPNLVMKRVRYREATVKGLGDGGWNYNAEVVVALKMFVLPGKVQRLKEPSTSYSRPMYTKL